MKTHKSLMASCLSVLSITLFIQHAQAAAAFDPNSPWMLGDWNGQRTALQAQGYDFSFGYTGEYAGILASKNTSTHGSAYTGQLALGTHFDLNKILGWQDTEAQITLTYRDGQSLSEHSPALAGHLSSVQEVWGREQTWRLTDLWIKKKFLDQKLDVKVGRFGEGEDFNSFDCDFQNLALCGSQVGNWVGDQWYNWPVSQWAMRVKYNLQPDLYTQIGVYEYNPENLDRGKGKAESVWTGMLFCRELGLMAELAAYLGKNSDAAKFEHLRDQTKEAINRHAWDGEWYLQAFDDDGMKVGSHASPNEEQIYLNPQSWAVLSGVAPGERARLALTKAEEFLGTDMGLVLLFPAYKAFRSDRGGVTTYPPGAKENAGIFVHTNPWFIIAQMLVGENDSAYNNYRKILPVLKNAIPDRHQVEPYVYCQNILGKEHPGFGMGRNSWLTGTAAWAYLAGTQYLLGIRPQYDGLMVDPHLPKGWSECTVWRRFRGAELEIRYTLSQQSACRWYLDGEPLEKPGFIPIERLKNGGRHQIEVK